MQKRQGAGPPRPEKPVHAAHGLPAVYARALHVLARVVDFCARRAWLVLLGALLLTAGSTTYTVRNLSVNTDTTGMIESDLAFRAAFDELAAAFPHYENAMVALVEADDPELARRAARALAQQFRARPDMFRDVFTPAADDFFRDRGLLYLSRQEASDTIERLKQTAPLLQTLSRDPTLRGLARFFGNRRLARGDDEQLKRLAPFLDALARVAESRVGDGRGELAWSDLIGAGPDDDKPLRHFVFVKPLLDFASLAPAEAALITAREIAERTTEGMAGPVAIRLTGDAALNAEELRSSSDGAMIAGIASFIFVSLVLGFGIRCWRLVLASLVTLMTGLLLTAGFATLAIGYLNLISVAFAVLFIGLGIDFAIHFCLRFQEEIDRGADTRLGLYYTVQGAGAALGVCTATTSLAFFAFSPTSFVGMSQLGIISGAGMFISFATTFTVLPALLSRLKVRPKSGRLPFGAGAGRAGIWRLFVTGAALGAGAVSVFFVADVSFDGNPLNLKDPETPSVRAFHDLAGESDKSPYAAQVLASSREQIRDIESKLAGVEEVDKVVSIFSFVPEHQAHKRVRMSEVAGTLPTEARVAGREPTNAQRRQSLGSLRDALARLGEAEVPAELAAAAKGAEGALARFAEAKGEAGQPYADLEQGIFAGFEPALKDLDTRLKADHVAVEDLPAELRSRYISSDGRFRVAVFPKHDVREQKALRGFVDAVEAAVPQATGSSIQIVRSADVVARSMVEAATLAAALIALMLLIGFRRILDVLLVMLPIALAASLTIAAMVVLGLSFNFANVIVLPLLIGLGVDSGIHLVMRAREGGFDDDLLATSTPRAVLLSALTTIGSFSTLALSAHRGMASMGELLTIAISMTLLCTLVVLPTLLEWIPPRRTRPMHKARRRVHARTGV